MNALHLPQGRFLLAVTRGLSDNVKQAMRRQSQSGYAVVIQAQQRGVSGYQESDFYRLQGS